MKAFTHVSASQISTYLSCKRQWWWNKIAGLPTTQKPSAALGEAVHTSIEGYLAGQPALHPVAVPARKKLDELRALSPLVETRMERRLRNGLVFIGRIDLLALDEALVVDHKTTSSLQYAKTEEELRGDVQMLAYAYELHCRKPVDEVRVAHNVLLTRGSGHRYTETSIPAPVILDGWRRIQDITDEMKQTAQVEAPDTVPPTWSACDKYGGCDFREQCRALKLAAKQSPYDDAPEASSSSTRMEVNDMSTKHSASVLRSMGLDDATILAAIQRGTCVDDVGLTGSTPAPAAKAAVINPPEAPASPREVKQEAVEEIKTPIGKSAEDVLKDQMRLLLSLGWAQDELDMLSDDTFLLAVKKGIKRAEVTVTLGTGTVQGAEYDDVIIGFEPIAPTAPTKRPTRSPVAVTPAAPVAASASADEKVRQPRNAVPRLKALGYPAEVAERMDAAEMKRILDAEIPYAAPAEEKPEPVVVQAPPPAAPVVAKEEPIVQAPAPVAAPAPASLHLYVDCVPEKGIGATDLLDMLAPYMRRVEAEGYRDEKSGKVEKVAHYGLVPYNNGEKQVIGYMLSDLAKFKAGHIVVDSRMPIAVRALEVLRPMAAVVISGRR